MARLSRSEVFVPDEGCPGLGKNFDYRKVWLGEHLREFSVSMMLGKRGGGTANAVYPDPLFRDLCYKNR